MESLWSTSHVALNGSFVTTGGAVHAKGAHPLYCPAMCWPVIPSREQVKIRNPLKNPESWAANEIALKEYQGHGLFENGYRGYNFTTLWAKSFIRVDYSSTSLLSCARIVNSCPSYTKGSTFRTKQCFLFFKFSWSHLPSCPGSSPFIIPEHSHHHQTHGTASIQALVLNLQECYNLEKSTGLWCSQTGACMLWKTASITPACSPQKPSEGINWTIQE